MNLAVDSRALPGALGAMPADVRRAADLWWLHPTCIVLLALVPVYLGVLAYDFSRVVQNVYVPSLLYGFGLAMIVSIAVGAQWALSNRQLGSARIPPRISQTTMLILLLPALAAYAIWFGPLLGQPQLLLEIASGARQEVRDAISTIPGVTTFTQFGVAYVIAYAIKRGAGLQRVRWYETAGLLLLFALAVFRGYAWAERLALIELLVCFAIARLAYLPITSTPRWRAANLLPAVGPFVLYGVFTASEYFRSWEYYANQYDSVWAFTLDRLIAYYATAVNNGIGTLTDLTGWPAYNGEYALEWAYLMPGLGKVLESVFGSVRDADKLWLEVYARPEFNSPTAYFRVLADLGYLGAILYFIAVGYVIGRAYAGFRRGHVFGLLAYPLFVLFLIESLRYSYFAETRVVPLIVGLVLIAVDMRRSRQPPSAVVS